MNDLSLVLSVEEASDYLELVDASNKTLSKVQEGYRSVLKLLLEHLFRQTLTPRLEELLSYLAELPEIDCVALPPDGNNVVTGWLIHHALMLALVSGYYAEMSEEA